MNPKYMRLLERYARRHLLKSVSDPELREKLTPNYQIGCKRVLLSNDYLTALSRPNVEVVSEGIAEVREGSVLTEDGQEREVDALIFCTGFRTTDLLSPVLSVGGTGFRSTRPGNPVPRLSRRHRRRIPQPVSAHRA